MSAERWKLLAAWIEQWVNDTDMFKEDLIEICRQGWDRETYAEGRRGSLIGPMYQSDFEDVVFDIISSGIGPDWPTYEARITQATERTALDVAEEALDVAVRAIGTAPDEVVPLDIEEANAE